MSTGSAVELFARVVKAVRNEPQTVESLIDRVGVSRNAANKYLSVMFDLALVDRERVSRRYVYRWSA